MMIIKHALVDRNCGPKIRSLLTCVVKRNYPVDGQVILAHDRLLRG